MLWSYGVTTVPFRICCTLPRTLTSLKSAGFDDPRLFVDGSVDGSEYRRTPAWSHMGVTTRDAAIGAFGNWVMALAELYIREPLAKRFAVFQDDVVVVKNLRGYLESVPYPEGGYCNLHSFPSNEKLATSKGWYLSNQYGRSAVALVFDVRAVQEILCSRDIVEKPTHVARKKDQIDGSVVTALAKVGIKEYVHSPSLCQHIGAVSTLGHVEYPQSQTFPGEDWDAMRLLDH